MKIWSLISLLVPATNLFLTVNVSASELSDKPASPYQKELDSAVSTEIDYLLWFSNQDGLHSPTVATGKSPNLPSKWSSGVRAAIAGQRAHWNTELCYTYYATRSTDTAHADIETILSSTPSTAGIFKVREMWNLHFNRLDLQLGRKILFGDHFLLEPFFGVEGLGIFQKLNLTTSTVFLDLTTALQATNVVDSKNKNSVLGIGPRAGVKANLDLKGGFGLYGMLGVNILWNKFIIKQDYNETDYYSSSSPTTLVDQVKSLSQGGSVFNADLEIGFNWRYLFKTSNLEMTLKAGWEQHYYIDIVRFCDFYLQQTSLGTAAYSTNGNLALSGFTVGMFLKY